MLELDGVVKSYSGAGEEVRAVDGVSLQVQAGEIVAIQGPSGSGKTTLLLLIAGLLAPEQGAIRFAGRELSGLSEDQVSDYLMHDIGFIYQNYRLMPRVSALENAALKLLVGGIGLAEAKERALPWLQRLGLGDRSEHTPEELSGGERQRVAIARALAGNPRLILADEPTGNLDSASAANVADLLFKLREEAGTTLILVTHDDALAARCTRRVRIRDGVIVDDTNRATAARSIGPQAAS